MFVHRFSRRRALASSAAAMAGAFAAPALSRAADVPPLDNSIRLFTLPTRVFKTADATRERTESWICWLFAETTIARSLQARALQVQLFSGERLVRTSIYGTDAVGALTIAPQLAPKRPDGSVSQTPIFWPQAIRIRCVEPVAVKIDAMRIDVDFGDGARLVRSTVVVPVEVYVQKTALIYPFKGRGVITQAGVTNGGHGNRSGQFALDAVGLDDRYGIYVRAGGRHSEDYAGWGRALIAPAAGVVVRARGDRPDQPDPEASDPKFYAPEYPNGGDPGNHLIIDHGNGEFSMMAHFQAGSMAVKAGDRVEQGQPVGKLGSSGDTNTPHLHYQLQAGPDWEWADALPCKFANVGVTPLVRGAYFNAT